MAAAAAACALFVLGALLGRSLFFPSAPDNDAVAAAAQELRGEMQAGIDKALAAFAADFETRQARLLEELGAGLVARSRADTEDLLAAALQRLEGVRSEDRRQLEDLVNRLVAQHKADYISLRKDLETLASCTEESLRRAGQRFRELALSSLSGGEQAPK